MGHGDGASMRVTMTSTPSLKESFLLTNHRGTKRKCQYLPWLSFHPSGTNMGKAFPYWSTTLVEVLQVLTPCLKNGVSVLRCGFVRLGSISSLLGKIASCLRFGSALLVRE